MNNNGHNFFRTPAIPNTDAIYVRFQVLLPVHGQLRFLAYSSKALPHLYCTLLPQQATGSAKPEIVKRFRICPRRCDNHFLTSCSLPHSIGPEYNSCIPSRLVIVEIDMVVVIVVVVISNFHLRGSWSNQSIWVKRPSHEMCTLQSYTTFKP